MKKNNYWIYIILSTLIIVFFILFGFKTNSQSKELILWNDLNTKKEIINYVEDITNENSKNYIPIEDRIVVFDLDGTLYSEEPIYLSRKLYKYRVLEDKNYNATIEQIEVANNINYLNNDINASIYKGMIINEYETYINDFLVNKNLKQDFYQPMLQLITYLQKNDFTIYICSGTDYYLIRTLIKDIINIPDNQIIGTEPVIENQVLVGKYLDKNVNEKKIINIENKIGKKPIMAFGNSSSDYDMLNYTITNNKYKSKSFIVVNDDLKEKNILKKEAKKNKWTIISMKKDWKVK